MASNRASQPFKSLFSRNTLAHATSGSLASIVAMTALYPLDRIRSLAQQDSSLTGLAALRSILNQEGWRGLYFGMGPMLVSLGVSNFVYFYWHVALKAAVQILRPPSERLEDLGTIPSLLIAALAGTINVCLTTPLWVATTRLAVQTKTKVAKPYLGLRDALGRIVREEGVAGAWSGLVPSLMLVSNPTIQFVAYEKLKVLVLWFVHGVAHNADAMFALDDADPNAALDEEQVAFITGSAPQLTNLETVLLGGLAKLVATILTYPVQVAQTRLRMTTDASGKPKYRGTLHCLSSIYQTEGWRGLFAGMSAKIVQSVSTSAILFLIYEKLSAAIFQAMLRSRTVKKLAA